MTITHHAMRARIPVVGLVGLAAALAYAGSALAQAEVVATPALPAYGQSVSIDLSDTNWPVYLPATRYTRAGSVIEIEYEYVTDGFGPSRPDFGFTPLALGELAPGNYLVHARLLDIAAPSTPPLDLTRQIAVMPPSAWGIYTLPLAPQAFSATQAIVRSAAYFDPASMNASVSGNVVRVDFDYQLEAPGAGPTSKNSSTFGSVRIPDLAPGNYRVEGWGRSSLETGYEKFFTREFSVAPTVTVVEFYSALLDHYFVSAGSEEIDLLDRGGQGDWKRTGQRFSAWLRQADAPAGIVPVCRFYASGPNSHFYTGSRQECDGLKALEQQQRAEAVARGEPFLGWAYETIAFWAGVPQGGQCAGGLSPVYRAYNGRAVQMDSNHRLMPDAMQRDAMLYGWLDEGVQLCSAAS